MKRRTFTPKFKTKVVLEALKEVQTLSQLAQKYNISPTQISGWKRDFLGKAELVFGHPTKSKADEQDAERTQFLKTIGELTMEVNFLKKNLRN